MWLLWLKATIIGTTRRHLLQDCIETSLDRCLNCDRTTIFGRIRLSTTVLEKYEIGKIISITLATARFVPLAYSLCAGSLVLRKHPSESFFGATLFTRTRRIDREFKVGFSLFAYYASTTLRLYLRISKLCDYNKDALCNLEKVTWLLRSHELSHIFL